MDYDQRLYYFNWINGMLNADPNFVSNVMWFDEATFCSNGSVNRHNLHYWSEHNSHWIQEEFNHVDGRVTCGVGYYMVKV